MLLVRVYDEFIQTHPWENGEKSQESPMHRFISALNCFTTNTQDLRSTCVAYCPKGHLGSLNSLIPATKTVHFHFW